MHRWLDDCDSPMKSRDHGNCGILPEKNGLREKRYVSNQRAFHYLYERVSLRRPTLENAGTPKYAVAGTTLKTLQMGRTY